MLDKLELEVVTHKLPFRLNHVNCFVAEGEDGHLVIDAGLHRDETVELWDEVLADKNVSDILVTHYHPDHIGYAGGLQEKHKARVSMSKVDANNARSAWSEDYLSKLLDKYNECGIPASISQEMLDNTRDFLPRISPLPKIDHYFEEYEKIKIGKYEYEVIFTPGHSDGLVNFYNEDEKVLISTDHILPRITPNISYWFYGDDNPLKTYLQSLNKVKALNADYVIPSHGKPFYVANKRIDEIIQHHDDRLNKTIEKIPGNHTIHTICNAMFDFELTIHETRFAIGETIAHLEYLRINGDIERYEVDGIWHYDVK